MPIQKTQAPCMLRKLFQPAKAIALLPAQQVKKLYPQCRLRMFLVAYIGYFTYYFGRSSFDVSKQYITTLTADQLGLIGAALGVAYGLSKFLMGNISDRSNAKIFLATGLFISGILNLLTFLLKRWRHGDVCHYVYQWLGARYGLAALR